MLRFHEVEDLMNVFPDAHNSPCTAVEYKAWYITMSNLVVSCSATAKSENTSPCARVLHSEKRNLLAASFNSTEKIYQNDTRNAFLHAGLLIASGTMYVYPEVESSSSMSLIISAIVFFMRWPKRSRCLRSISMAESSRYNSVRSNMHAALFSSDMSQSMLWQPAPCVTAPSGRLIR